MYPQVVDERETLIHVLAGRSLARYGDGEFKICDGNGCKSNPLKDEAMSARMREILWRSGECLVGVPNIRSDTPKAEFWGKFMAYAKYYDPARRYCSSFVTRPEAPVTSKQAVTNFLWTSSPQQTLSTAFMVVLPKPGSAGDAGGIESPTRAPAGAGRQMGVPHGVGSDSPAGTGAPT